MTPTRNTLAARVRDGAGKGSARRLRAQGLVPAVVYGRHLEDPVHIAVDPIEVKKAIATPHKFNTLLSLKLDGQPERLVLLKDYQQDPLSREMLHADFIDVRENEQVKVNVPLVLTGRAVGVAEGGILSQSRRDLEIFAMPGAIPEKIEADVSHLKIAQSLHINDV
ncbi:MAG TPA: 50S ribosomal protein L25, partial [Myxococcaceae bacterium]